jgi:hypothetical protein
MRLDRRRSLRAPVVDALESRTLLTDVLQGGFEQPSAGPPGQWGSWVYGPTGSAWSFAGGAGLTANGSGFTSGNPAAPEGSQVAFLQGAGQVSQSADGWSAGRYVLQFRAAQRANMPGNSQDFQALVDGQVVGTFRPSTVIYGTYSTAPFSLGAGSHTFTFRSLDSDGGDNTAFLDAVTVQAVAGLSDSGFEQPSAGPPGQWGSWVYGPTGSAWSFAGGAGLTANGSGFTSGNPAAPEGSQVAFLQANGQVSQSADGWSAGRYVLQFRAAQRANMPGNDQQVQALVDGQVVGTIHPSGTSYAVYATVPFTLTAGAHTFALRGLNTSGDHTAFVDDVQVLAAPLPGATGAPNAGINLEGNGYGTAGPTWVDVSKLLNGWGQLASPWVADPNIPVDPYGYPLVDAGTGTPMNGYPLGTYNLSYEGSGTVTIFGLGHLAGPITTAGNVHTGQIIVDKTNEATGQLLYVILTGVDPTNPIRNLHIYMPGYDASNAPTFAPEFLDRLRPFSTIRFMKWMRTEGSPVAHWSDRTPTTTLLQSGNAGVAYEYMVELANTTHKDIWVNVPVLADDNYIHQFARLIRDHLDPGLKVYVEYGNELWAPGSVDYNELVAAARANTALPPGSDYELAARQNAFMIRKIGQIFRSELGDRSAAVRPVLNGQAAWNSFQTIALNYLASTGTPSDDIYGLAIAPYIDDGNNDPNVTLDQLFARMNAALPGIQDQVASNRQLATNYGVNLVAYEGGQDLVATDNVSIPVKQAAQHDSRMGQVMRAFYDIWQQQGGSLFMQFTLAYVEKPWGFWGLLTSMEEPGSVKYDAMMSEFLPGGDATLDDSVGYDDFSVVAANDGTAGTKWWSQGDFNGDNVVDSLDMAIVKRNVRGLTATQGVTVSLFGTPVTGQVGTALSLQGAADPGLTQTWRLSMNGVTVAQGPGTGLSYIPAVAGTYVLDLTVQDATGATASDRRNIVVS